MPEDVPQILETMDDDAIRWQYCAICGEQQQRVVRQAGRPDFATCDNCQSAFVLEDGGKMRMLYGKISDTMPQTREFALKKWRLYLEIRVSAQKEQNPKAAEESDIPPEIMSTLSEGFIGKYASHHDALAALESEKSELLYTHEKKIAPPPRTLRETGELPNLDELFKDTED